MNKELENFARHSLKLGLAKCTISQQEVFKLMYSKDPSASIEEVVDKMPVDRLDWAMSQVQNTLHKNEK